MLSFEIGFFLLSVMPLISIQDVARISSLLLFIAESYYSNVYCNHMYCVPEAWSQLHQDIHAQILCAVIWSDPETSGVYY